MKSGHDVIAGDYVYVADSMKSGMGVFARRSISKNTTVHICPILLVASNKLHHLDDTTLSGYVFSWDDAEEWCAFALGAGSLFNHSKYPNCHYQMYQKYDRDEATGFVYPFNAISFTTYQDVRENDELTVDYTGGGSIELWFDPID